MKSLHILHITHSLNVGGLERVVVDLAKGFKKKGYIVSICCLDGKEPLGNEAESAGIKVYSLNKGPGIKCGLPFKIAKIIREERIDLIHTHNESGLIYGVTAAFLARVSNIVHTDHGKEPGYDEKKALKLAEKILLKKLDHVVAVSEDLKNKIVQSTGISKDKILVIPNGIDVEHFYQPNLRDEVRRKLGISSDTFVIANIARMVPLKNQSFLINIFKEVVVDYPNVKLLLVGDGPMRYELQAYCKNMGLSKSIIFLGERKDIFELLSAVDLFVLPSLTEGTSITLIEAMSSGTPVVASEVGGNSEVIENGKTGFLNPLGQIEMWITTIKSLIRNKEDRIRVAQNAKMEVVKKFSLEGMIGNYEKIYLSKMGIKIIKP
jgi:sugar transferase (PEP-CTERM/EpsH1 system associated)